MRVLLLLYLSAGACLARHGDPYVCKRLCTGVPEPCPPGDSAGVPPGGWAGGGGHWEGVWGDR